MIEWLIIEPWGRLGLRMYGDRAFVHCYITQWAPSIRRACIAKWHQFKGLLRGRGISKVYSAVPSDDAKVNKWQTMFGMTRAGAVGDLLFYEQEV